jgi:hypothetical protein
MTPPDLQEALIEYKNQLAVVAEGIKDKLKLPQDGASQSLSVPTQTEPDPQVWRGIFSPVYKWKVLFSQQVKIRSSELPHLKPHITIDRRVLEEDDD